MVKNDIQDPGDGAFWNKLLPCCFGLDNAPRMMHNNSLGASPSGGGSKPWMTRGTSRIVEEVRDVI